MTDYQKIKEQLINLRSEIMENLAQGQKNTIENKPGGVGDEGDHANQERAQELMRLFSKRELKKLNSIDDALKRIDSNDYGYCDECGEPIEMKRLKAVPFTRLCFDCQSNMEISYSSDTEEDDYSDMGADDSDHM